MTKEKLLKIFYIDSACVGFWTHSLLSLTDTWTSFVMASLSPSHVYFWRHIWSFEKLFFSNWSSKVLIKRKIIVEIFISRYHVRLIKSTRVWKDLNFKYPLSWYHLLDTILMFVFFYFVRFWVMSINRMCLNLLVGHKDWMKSKILNIASYSILISPL